MAGVDGTAFTFTNSAALLGPHDPRYAANPVGSDARSRSAGDPPHRFEAIAAEYVREITALRPRGPYLLGGYSIGAVVALEVALQLQKRGDDVSLLLVFAAYAPGSPPPRSLARRLALHLGRLVSPPPGKGRWPY